MGKEVKPDLSRLNSDKLEAYGSIPEMGNQKKSEFKILINLNSNPGLSVRE
jgi:hypothetical protein